MSLFKSLMSRLFGAGGPKGPHKLRLAVGAMVLVAATVGVCWYFWGKPRSLRSQVSYSIGAQFGRSLKVQDLDLSAHSLARGMADGLDGGELALTDDEMQAAMTKLNQERQKLQQIEAEKNKIKADEFMSSNRHKDGMRTSRSGLQYVMLTEGKGVSPKDEDIVVVSYRATLIDGKEFDSSARRRNNAAEFPLKGVIPGWTEGLQMMRKGGKAKFFIPPELAYGDRPRQNIPPNSVLIFDVELVDVKPAGSVRDRSPSAPTLAKTPAKPSTKPQPVENIRAKSGDTNGRLPSSEKKK